MKNKLVVWGTNAQNEKVLIALELHAETNKVVLYTFPESIASEDFVNKMMAEWRNGAEVPFPEGFTTGERELSVVESILPEDIQVERQDLIQRAQTEWQFAVLSAKLHQAYQQELAEFKERIDQLPTYDHALWENLRSFWDKVQSQSRDRNLFREHADSLRDNINVLFDDLKKLRSRMQDEFTNTSQRIFNDFNTALDDVEKRIAAGGNKLNSVFEDLKQLQRRYRDAKMSNEHRNSLWERLDGAFKAAKERKFGPSANEGSLVERHGRRLDGLGEAIRRMEDSIKRDEDELTFQRRKVDASEGQLEAQIRMAKIKMIDERVASKREKLAEMYHTRNEVERQINNAKDKETKRAEKEAERQRLEAAREAAKKEIADKTTPRPERKGRQQQTETPAADASVSKDETQPPVDVETIVDATATETPALHTTENGTHSEPVPMEEPATEQAPAIEEPPVPQVAVITMPEEEMPAAPEQEMPAAEETAAAPETESGSTELPTAETEPAPVETLASVEDTPAEETTPAEVITSTEETTPAEVLAEAQSSETEADSKQA